MSHILSSCLLDSHILVIFSLLPAWSPSWCKHTFHHESSQICSDNTRLWQSVYAQQSGPLADSLRWSQQCKSWKFSNVSWTSSLCIFSFMATSTSGWSTYPYLSSASPPSSTTFSVMRLALILFLALTHSFLYHQSFLPTCTLPDPIYIPGISFWERVLFWLASLPRTNWSSSQFPTNPKFFSGRLVIEMKSVMQISKV